jgi:hypothetical protein
VTPLELCLWVGLVEVPAGMRGSGGGMYRMAGAALVEARSPTPARRTLNAPRQGCPWGRTTTSPATAPCAGRARPTAWAGSVHHPVNAPDGGKGRLPRAVKHLPDVKAVTGVTRGAFVEVERKWPVGGRQRDDVEGAAGARIGSSRGATDAGADR